MKKVFLFLFLFPISIISFSQFYNYAYGPVFPYPSSGSGKIISVKGGAIMYLQVNTDSSIAVQLYEPPYHGLSKQIIQPSFFPVKGGQIENIFSSNGDALIFISGKDNDSSQLFRITLDGSSGKLKEAVEIFNIRHLVSSKSREDIQYPGFIVRQSAKGDAYAVAAINPSQMGKQPIIQFSVFDTLGGEWKRPYKSKLPDKFENLKPVDLVVMSPQQATLLTYGFIEERKIKNGDVIMAMLEKSKPEMRISELYYSNDLVLQSGVARYDSIFNKIFLLSAANRQSQENRMVTDLVRIDVPSAKIENDSILGFNAVTNAKLTRITGEENPLFFPVDFFLKGLTGYLVIYQQLIPGSASDTSVHARINNTVFAEYNDDYTNVKSFIVPSSTDIKLPGLSPFYLHKMELAGVPFQFENQYRTGKFLTDDHSYFWVQNDVSTNFMSTDGSGLSLFKNNGDAASFYWVLSGDALLPRRQFLAGKPTDKEGVHLLVPGVGCFDKLNGVWVTLQEEAKEQYPGLKVVWLQP